MRRQNDLSATVDNLNLQLEDLGYKVKGENGIPFRRYFQKISGNTRTHNVHVFEQNNPEIDRHLKFRDWMRIHAEDRDAYAALKQVMAGECSGDMQVYCLGKAKFMADINAKAGWNDMRIVTVMTHEEWETYHCIKKEQIFYRHTHVKYDEKHPSLMDPNHFHFVLYHGATIVTIGHVELLDTKTAALRALATDTPHKRKGYGTYMIELLEKWIRGQGRTIIKLHADLRAERFYRKLGYIDMPFDDPSISTEFIDLGKVL